MSKAIVIAGTDTDVGKTVFAAALAGAIDAAYWKPVQAGLEGETDSQTVRRLGNLSSEQVLPEAYRLKIAASPHYAAECEGIEIIPEELQLPKTQRPLVIETAGGLAVPLSKSFLQIDLLATWELPVILVSSTRLGTINHSLLSIEALKRRNIPILGVAFVGPPAPHSAQIIGAMGRIRTLGTLPHLASLNASTLGAAFAQNFSVAGMLGAGGGIG